MAATEEEIDALIALIRNETSEQGNTRARIANALQGIKDHANAKALFKGVYANGPKEAGTFWVTSSAIWMAKLPFNSTVPPTQNNAWWESVFEGGIGTFDTFVSSAGVNNLGANTTLSGTPVLEAVKKMLSRPFNVMGVYINVSSGLHEEGATPTVAVSGGVNTNDEDEGVTARRVLKNGQPWQTFTGNTFSFNDSPTADTTYRVEATGGKSGAKASQATVDFDLYHRYGPAAARPNAATSRDLTGSIYRSQGNTGIILNTQTAERNFYIILAPGESLVSVIDQDALNLNITGEYVLVNPNFSVNNAAGTAVAGYKLYQKTQGVPYSFNHRHSITLS